VETKITKGEWSISYGTLVKIGSINYEMENPHDAHLIAAAPKMYKMLENAMCLLAENDKECKALSKEIRLLRAEARVEK